MKRSIRNCYFMELEFSKDVRKSLLKEYRIQFWLAEHRRQSKKIGAGVALLPIFSTVTYLFHKLFDKNLCYKDMHVQQFFYVVVWGQIREENIMRSGFQQEKDVE